MSEISISIDSPVPSEGDTVVQPGGSTLSITYTIASDAGINDYEVDYSIYYANEPVKESGDIHLASRTVPGTYTDTIPFPDQNAPDYGQRFGIAITVTVDAMTTASDTTGVGFRTLPDSWAPYVPPAYGSEEEEQLHYWGGHAVSNGPPPDDSEILTPPIASPPGMPPPSYPENPWDGSTSDRPVEDELL